MIKYIKLIAVSADPAQGSAGHPESSRPLSAETPSAAPFSTASWPVAPPLSSRVAAAGPASGAGRAASRMRAAAADENSCFRGLCDPSAVRACSPRRL